MTDFQTSDFMQTLKLRQLRGQNLLSITELDRLLSSPHPLDPDMPGGALLEQARQAAGDLNSQSGQEQAAQRCEALIAQAVNLGHPAQSLPDAQGRMGLAMTLATAHLWLCSRAVHALHAELHAAASQQKDSQKQTQDSELAREQVMARQMRRWHSVYTQAGAEWSEELTQITEMMEPSDLTWDWQQTLKVLEGMFIIAETFRATNDSWEHLSLMARREADLSLAHIRHLSRTRYHEGRRLNSHAFWAENDPRTIAAQMNSLWAEHTARHGHPHRTDWGDEPLVTAARALKLPSATSTLYSDPQTAFILAWAGPHAAAVIRRARKSGLNAYAAFPHTSPKTLSSLIRKLRREELHPEVRAALTLTLGLLSPRN